MKEKSIVRNNLMNEKDYSYYCGNCNSMNRVKWKSKLNQFQCNACGWISELPEGFIDRYKKKWNK